MKARYRQFDNSTEASTPGPHSIAPTPVKGSKEALFLTNQISTKSSEPSTFMPAPVESFVLQNG